MDLRAFLPEKSVSEGDSWSIDLDGLINVLAPGGNLKIVPEDVAGVAGPGKGPGSALPGLAPPPPCLGPSPRHSGLYFLECGQ